MSETTSDTIRVAHSPDSDDAFMFHALARREIDAEGLRFSFEAHDTESLNALAEASDAPDVLAVSAARYATITERYLLLPHGASVGRGYGPVVVSAGSSALALGELAGKKIGVPGLRTTAYLVLRILLDRFDPVTIPIAPYELVWRALRSRAVDAALVIHEGRLTFEREGFGFVCDVGDAWTKAHGVPLPLGVNVIRRALGEERIARVSRVVRRSIAWAFAHRDEVMRALLTATERATPLDAAALDRYLAMYANDDTLEMRADVIAGLKTLFAEAARRELLPKAPSIELAP